MMFFVSQSFSRILQVSQSCFLSAGSVCLAGSIFSQSRPFQSLNLVSQFKNSNSLGLTEKNARLGVSQSLREFTIRTKKYFVDATWKHFFYAPAKPVLQRTSTRQIKFPIKEARLCFTREISRFREDLKLRDVSVLRPKLFCVDIDKGMYVI